MPSSVRSRQGFTIVELLVVAGMTCGLIALLVPALSSTHMAAQEVTSENRLSAFGRGIILYANVNDGALSSGAFDHFRDGDIRNHGWVGDLIGIKACVPGKMLDPADPHTLSETVGDYSGVTPENQANIADGLKAKRWEPGTVAAKASGPAFFDHDDPWQQGYNTNYVTTWHFSRGDPTAPSGFNGAREKGLTDGDGPLSENYLSSKINVSPARIALMAPGRPVGEERSRITEQQAAGLEAFAGVAVAKAGDCMTASFTDGMLVPFRSAELGGGPDQFVHDLSAIFPCHAPTAADATGGYAPVLFADCHVGKVTDTVSVGDASKGDGFIGNDRTLGVLDDDAYREVSDTMWIKRLRRKR